jgi:hypothetical protein
MITTYQFDIQVSVYWKFHCIVEVVSLIGFVPFEKGPVTGTVHDKDHIFSYVSSHLSFLFFTFSGLITFSECLGFFFRHKFSLDCQAGSAKMWNYHVQS